MMRFVIVLTVVAITSASSYEWEYTGDLYVPLRLPRLSERFNQLVASKKDIDGGSPLKENDIYGGGKSRAMEVPPLTRGNQVFVNILQASSPSSLASPANNNNGRNVKQMDGGGVENTKRDRQ